MTFATKQNYHDTTEAPTDYSQAFKAAEHFDPIYDRILIKRELSAAERKLAKSGLVMADATKDVYKSSEGVLIKCSPDADERAKALVGKRILFAKYSGEDIVVNHPGGKEEFVLATDTDIFGELK